jgi:hypothetical protein
MSVEDRIRQLAEEIVACQDDGKTAVLAEELQTAILERIAYLRMKLRAVPLGRYDAPLN